MKYESSLINSLIEFESRPWGSFFVFSKNEKCTVKILEVTKGECLSLQKHKNRDQLYYIIDELTIVLFKNGQRMIIDAKPGEFFYFKAGELHRAINNSRKEKARYLEVSYGDYDEEDIERLEDKYGRK